jgi:hypothetical protein
MAFKKVASSLPILQHSILIARRPVMSAERHLAGTGFQQLFFGSHLVMRLRLIGSDNLVPQNVK